LNVKSSYSFRDAYGLPEQIIASAKKAGHSYIGICDKGGTWGHIPFWKAGKDIKVLFGVELNIVPDTEKNPDTDQMIFIAKDSEGLEELYELVSVATEQFYYAPRVTYQQVKALKHVIRIATTWTPDLAARFKAVQRDFYLGATPTPGYLLNACVRGSHKVVIAPEVLFPDPDDEEAWKLMRSIKGRQKPDEIPNSDAWMISADDLSLRFERVGVSEDAISDWVSNTNAVAASCSAEPATGENVKPLTNKTLEQLCVEGAKRRGIDLKKEPNKSRYEREMELIREKGFEDYFLLIADLVSWAKDRMFVGPARGSSAGSLVCFLTGIVEVNPLDYGLLFERFIDLNREDLPDIDIDFPDDKRDQVFEYIISKYGAERVARIGTISVFKPKSALNDVAKSYNVPSWELKKLTDVMIERSSGDARANMAIEDTFNQFDAGKELLKQYPKLFMATKIEGHPRHTGQHAAGVIVSNDEISRYASTNRRNGAYIAMLNKNDVESIGLLKIDALGLKTLSVIEDCCDQVSMDPRDLYTVALDDPDAIRIFAEDRVAGIFQFEGYAVRSLMRQMGVKSFEDIVALTALARPGPLHCGGAMEFISRRTGEKDWDYEIPGLENHTSHTYGTIVYQEQVMSITRDLGDMSWQDVSALRKAMSKSLGEEFFNAYRDKFLKGTRKRGIDDGAALTLWNDMCTFGSWAFNLSHAVSYGLLSYWCAYLKSRFPLEFAVAQLRRTHGEDHVKRLLRELAKENVEIIPFNIDVSEKAWSVHDGKLYGGFLEVNGIGPVIADKMIALRDELGDGWYRKLTPKQREKLLAPNNTPWHNLNRLRREFKDWYDDPWSKRVNGEKLKRKISFVEDIDESKKGEWTVIATLKQRNLRDMNETQSLAKRGGKEILVNNLFLNLIFEDDTSSILMTVPRYKYAQLGAKLMETEADGKDFYVKGYISTPGFRKISITEIERMDHVTDDNQTQA
jgi:DNA polymerase III alpha subunit